MSNMHLAASPTAVRLRVLERAAGMCLRPVELIRPRLQAVNAFAMPIRSIARRSINGAALNGQQNVFLHEALVSLIATPENTAVSITAIAGASMGAYKISVRYQDEVSNYFSNPPVYSFQVPSR